MRRSNCHRKGCSRIRSDFSFFLSRRRPPRFENRWFCSETCLQLHVEAALSERWQALSRERQRFMPRPRLGTILLECACVGRDQIERARKCQMQAGEGRIGEWLLRLGYVTEQQVTFALSRQFGLPVIKLRESERPSDAAHLVPGRVARSLRFLPVGLDDQQDALRIAVSPPLDLHFQEALRRMIGKGLVTFIADASTLATLLDRWYEFEAAREQDVAAYTTFEDVREIARSTADFACANRAENLQFEFPGGCFWTRVDFSSGSIHQLYRHAPAAEPALADPLREVFACGIPAAC